MLLIHKRKGNIKSSWPQFLSGFFSSRRRHTRCSRDWSSDVCSSDLGRTLDLVLATVPEDSARLPGELIPFLPMLGMEAVLDRLAGELPEGRRRLLTQIVLARLPREADAVLARLPTLEARLACDLVRGLVARAPERSNEVARQLLAQRDEALRLEGLAALEAAAGEVPMRPLCELLRDASEVVRVRAAEVLGRRGDESILDALREP